MTKSLQSFTIAWNELYETYSVRKRDFDLFETCLKPQKRKKESISFKMINAASSAKLFVTTAITINIPLLDKMKMELKGF